MLLYYAIVYRVKENTKEFHKITKLIKQHGLKARKERLKLFRNMGGLNSNLKFEFKRKFNN